MTPTQIYEKISDIVVNGVKTTQLKLCHAKTATWIANNLQCVNFNLVLWGVGEDVFHSGILSPSGELISSYYSGAPKHSLTPDQGLLIPNGEVLPKISEISIADFISQYLNKLHEDTTSVDLNVGLAVVDKEDEFVKKNKVIYNEPKKNLSKAARVTY